LRPLTPLLLVALFAAALAQPTARARQAAEVGESDYTVFSLAPGEEVIVENRRGGVRIEVGGEGSGELWASLPQKAAAAKGSKRTARRRRQAPAPATFRLERSANSLRITVGRAASAASPRVDLRVRVPSSARLKVYTSDGGVEVSGLPASLTAQTVSGDLRLSLPAPADASLTAQSLNGSVVLGEGIESRGAAARTLRGKFQARWGAGGSVVNLFSGRGRISLEALAAGAGRAETGGENEAGSDGAARRSAEPRRAGTRPQRAGTRPQRVRPAPDDAPVRAVPPRPMPAETPQEVDEDEVVRVESDLVTVNVSVIDRASGRGLQGLSAADFRVYEDNVEQTVEHFETAAAPFDLLLLLDLSGSTARVTDTIRSAAWRFVAVTRPQDRVGVIAFAGEAKVVSPLTSDRAALRASLDRLASPQGDTRLHDSLAYALDLLERGADPARRRALIVMSDGLDSALPNVTGVGSSTPYEEIRSRVQEFEGVVYSVWTNTEYYEAFSPLDIQPETYDLAHDRMGELAEAGGGLFYEVEKLEDLAGAYERVVADLGTVYSLSYRPTNKRRDGSWRAIRVRLPRRAEAVARGRRGYFAR